MLKLISQTAAAILFSVSATMANADALENTYVIDVLTLQDGTKYDDVIAYFETVVPLIEGHGLKRLRSMEVLAKMAGHEEVSPQIVQIWELEVEDPFTGIFSDPSYLQHVPLRDSLFNMERTQMWVGLDRIAE